MRISDWSSDVCSSDLRAFVEGDAPLLQKALQRAAPIGVEGLGAAADEMATDEDLRDGAAAGAGGQRRAHASTEIALLPRDRVDVDRAVGDDEAREEAADGTEELAPFQGEQHNEHVCMDRSRHRQTTK